MCHFLKALNALDWLPLLVERPFCPDLRRSGYPPVRLSVLHIRRVGVQRDCQPLRSVQIAGTLLIALFSAPGNENARQTLGRSILEPRQLPPLGKRFSLCSRLLPSVIAGVQARME